MQGGNQMTPYRSVSSGSAVPLNSSSTPWNATSRMHTPLRRATLVLLVLAAAGCAAIPPPPSTSDAEIGEVRAGSRVLNGYLQRDRLPNSLALLEPAPAAGSAQGLADEARHKETRHLKGTPRWELARQDANYIFPAAAKTFSCSLGFDIDARQTPHLATLMRRTMTDAGLSTYKAKDHYKRERPFVQYKEATCDPAGEARLLNDGSYPSGHAALGWAWGLVLAGLVPDRSDAVLARALSYGESRQVCGVHWASDVVAGRTLGAATYARLQGDPTFQAQQELAALELKSWRKNAPAPRQNCESEAAALAVR
jgi:acid phosphatase (class A)